MKKDIIILAAGVGSRLRPLTDSIPKTMVKVNGRSIIERLLNQIKTVSEIETRIKIVVGYKSEVIIDFIKELGIDVEIINNQNYSSTNNMYSLNLALNEIKEDNNSLVIINADCVYETYIIEKMIMADGDFIAIDKRVFSEESMKVHLNKDNKVISMSKTLKENENIHVSMDIYTLSYKSKERLKAIVAEIINNGELNSWTEVAIDILSKGKDSEIGVIDFENKWMEIDNFDDLKNAEKIFTV